MTLRDLIESFERLPTDELKRLLALMPSPDPSQAKIDREENIPAIMIVLTERTVDEVVEKHVRMN